MVGLPQTRSTDRAAGPDAGAPVPSRLLAGSNMLLSPTARQALRALIFLATREGSGPVLGRDIADAEGIPRPFLAKILLVMRNRGLVRSTKGPGGGYYLAGPAGDIMVRDVIEAFDGHHDLGRVCVLGLDQCSDEEPCALHVQWKHFREEMERTMWNLTLAEAASTLEKKRTRPQSG
jgi:Rrf2 family iron-sulfur cluster assembly transcriptional regulator